MTDHILLHGAEVRVGDILVLTNADEYEGFEEGHQMTVIELDYTDINLPFLVRWMGEVEDEDEWPYPFEVEKLCKSVMDGDEFSEVNKEKEVL